MRARRFHLAREWTTWPSAPTSGMSKVTGCLIGLAESLGVKNATLMWPVRIAAAGKQVTPFRCQR